MTSSLKTTASSSKTMGKDDPAVPILVPTLPIYCMGGANLLI